MKLIVDQSLEDKDEIPHTREQISGLPYATLVAQIEGGKPSLMVLGYVDNDQLQWVAVNSASIVTRHGRLVRTVGFGEEIRGVDIATGDFLANAPHLLGNQPIQYVLNMEIDGKTPVTLRLNCTAWREAEEEIVILDYKFATFRLREDCKSDSGQSFNSLYWVDQQNGFVWRSVQPVTAGQYSLTINVLKPAG